MDEKLEAIFDEVNNGFAFAISKWDSYNSYHEGKSVIEEEFDELWDEIKGKQNVDRLRKEALHTAVTAIRFIYDLLPEGSGHE